MQYGIRENRSPKHSYGRIVIPAVIFTIVAGLILVHWISSGNQGQISPASGKQAATQIASHKTLNGNYVTFTYSGKYSAKRLSAKDNDLELYMLTADTVYDKNLAVSVSQLPGGNLSSDSAYLLRLSQPGTYTKSQVEVAGAPAIIWTKNDNLEETVFITHDNTVAALAFTTSVPSDNLEPEVTALLATFHWK